MVVTPDLIKLQKQMILDAVEHTFPEKEWRYVIADTEALALIDSVVSRDEIISMNIVGIEELESRRPPHHDMNAIYFLTPKPHILECLLSEFKRRPPRLQGGHLVWTSSPSDAMRARLARQAQTSSEWIKSERILPINFHPMESHVFTFRDPKSFYPLYNPNCGSYDFSKEDPQADPAESQNLLRREISALAKKILGICVALGEFPIIRYFISSNEYRAQVLSYNLAMELQHELERYQKYMARGGQQWPSQEDKSRPRGILFIVDRSMDPVAPLLHEMSYQAMAHDLLPIEEKDGKIIYTPTQADPSAEPTPGVLNDEDQVWTKVRHKHMMDTIQIVSADFKKFMDDHPEFASADNANSVFALKTMLAALPHFQGMKDAYELHLDMTQQCMNIVKEQELLDLADLEQTLATGLDSDNIKAKNVTERLVKMLDTPSTQIGNNRIRLILLYLIWRDGLLDADIEKLFRHSKIKGPVMRALSNHDLIGVRVIRRLRESYRPTYKHPVAKGAPVEDGMQWSRYVPVVKTMLDEQINGTLDRNTYPFADPAAAEEAATSAGPQTSLRSTKSTWTKHRAGSVEAKQRIIVFVAGGATYSEARSCYEAGQAYQRDVYLGSSHMISPNDWLAQLVEGREGRRSLYLDADLPKPKAPSHLWEPDPVANRPPPRPQGAPSSSGSVPQAGSHAPPRPQAQGHPGGHAPGGSGRPAAGPSSGRRHR